MVSINIKQRKELLKDLDYCVSSQNGFSDIMKRDSPIKKLFTVLLEEEEWYLLGKDCPPALKKGKKNG